MKKIRKLIRAVAAVGACAAAYAAVDEQFRKKEEPGDHRYSGIYEAYLKRPLDAFLSASALVILSPALLGTAAAVRLKLGTPVLFTQERPGKNEKVFKLYKFRTMTDERDASGELLPDEERLPAFGKLLRSTSLDELPELLNILKGDMAIVGPRPLLVKYLPRYTPEQRRRHEVRPGLTGLAASSFRNCGGWEKKFELDVEYVDHITFLMDAKIILRTVGMVLGRKDINEEGNATASEFMGLEAPAAEAAAESAAGE